MEVTLIECSGNILLFLRRMSSVGCVSIIMLQKVAAIVNKVAADLCFMPPKARCLLKKKFFSIAATSAAS